MSGRKWKVGDPHIEFRCHYCSALLGTGTIVEGAVAVVSPIGRSSMRISRRWLFSPDEVQRDAHLPPIVGSCWKHNTVVGDIIDEETGSSATRLRLSWADVTPAIEVYQREGRVGVVRLRLTDREDVTITGMENEVRAHQSGRKVPEHPLADGWLAKYREHPAPGIDGAL